MIWDSPQEANTFPTEFSLGPCGGPILLSVQLQKKQSTIDVIEEIKQTVVRAEEFNRSHRVVRLL